MNQRKKKISEKAKNFHQRISIESNFLNRLLQWTKSNDQRRSWSHHLGLHQILNNVPHCCSVCFFCRVVVLESRPTDNPMALSNLYILAGHENSYWSSARDRTLLRKASERPQLREKTPDLDLQLRCFVKGNVWFETVIGSFCYWSAGH